MKAPYTMMSIAVLAIGAACTKPAPRSAQGSAVGEGERGGDPAAVADASGTSPGLRNDDQRPITFDPQAAREARSARAVFQSAPGVELEGAAIFEEVNGGVRIRVDVRRAGSGRHGVHIHERPDCSDIPGKSMGGHFAPHQKLHGLPAEAEHHLGDLGNLTVEETGSGTLEITVPYATLDEGGPHSFVRRALVVHATTDQGRSAQPSGDSGEPIACAVINPA